MLMAVHPLLTAGLASCATAKIHVIDLFCSCTLQKAGRMIAGTVPLPPGVTHVLGLPYIALAPSSRCLHIMTHSLSTQSHTTDVTGNSLDRTAGFCEVDVQVKSQGLVRVQLQ